MNYYDDQVEQRAGTVTKKRRDKLFECDLGLYLHLCFYLLYTIIMVSVRESSTIPMYNLKLGQEGIAFTQVNTTLRRWKFGPRTRFTK